MEFESLLQGSLPRGGRTARLLAGLSGIPAGGKILCYNTDDRLTRALYAVKQAVLTVVRDSESEQWAKKALRSKRLVFLHSKFLDVTGGGFDAVALCPDSMEDDALSIDLAYAAKLLNEGGRLLLTFPAAGFDMAALRELVGQKFYKIQCIVNEGQASILSLKK